MLFNSYIFLFVFLPITLVVYYWSRIRFDREVSFVILVLASFIYYAYWKFSYLPILFISVVANYFLGAWLSKNSDRKSRWVLSLGVIGNLCALAYYKYANFFVDNLMLLTGESYSTFSIVLPLAISFFTFQQIAYLVDASKGEAKEYSFVHYCLFIAFFPQLIAGPIVHHKEMLPQFIDKARNYFDQHLFWQGCQQFSIGLFKKVVIADTVALYAGPVFLAADQGFEIVSWEAWIATLAYTFQLYFDFSAYSDMAIGIGKMFGIKLPRNFNSPYKAKSIIEFWRCWHMTLSRFLRDYLYIPLGGNKKGHIRRYLNLLATMLLGGLWHGASWNFVLWGALHGGYLVINSFWQEFVKKRGIDINSNIYKIFAQLLTFFVVMQAWVLFRAVTLDGAMAIYRALFDFNYLLSIDPTHSKTYFIGEPLVAILSLIACMIVAFICPNTEDFIDKQSAGRGTHRIWRLTFLPAVISAFLVISISSMNKVSEFLYFQF